uniref:Uncharacterized protein n=1 Tax=Bosea sp. NBC_00436 TaxID=2969620 RepID=A0A9E8CSD8_9HYPH
MRRILVVAALGFAAASISPVQAEETVASTVAMQLDLQSLEYTRHTREHRLAEMEWNMERQDRWRRRHRDDGYSYGRRYGGPPPWAPAHGYRRQYRDWDD